MSENGDTIKHIDTKRGPENIVNPEIITFVTLDDISLKFNKLIDLFSKNQKTLSSLLEYTIKNEKRLEIIQDQLIDEADEGQFIRTSGTVYTNRFTIIDTMVSPGHMVKGYNVKNDGPHNIYVGHNVTISSDIDADIIDVTTTVSRFEIVEPDEDIKFVFNRKTIRNVHILASGGDSQFRAWLVW